MGIVFNNKGALFLLTAIPALVAIVVYGSIRLRKAAALFDRGGNRLGGIGVWPQIAILLALALAILAAARPGWDPKPKPLRHRGRDIVFVLDVSKSMLADDLLPNRLENAKHAIYDCLETLEGDRVALVIFAGSASIKCPLTTDYNFVRSILDEVSWRSVDTGGTRIGDAIAKATDKILSKTAKGMQDVIVITDGEDHDPNSAKAIKELGDLGARLILVGLGDSKIGSRVLIDEGKGLRYLASDQGEVWTKMDPKQLRKLAELDPRGVFLDVGTRSVDLGKVYHRIVENDEKRFFGDQEIIVYTEKFQLFLVPAFILLLLPLVFVRRAAAVALVLTLLLPGAYAQEAQVVDPSQPPRQLYNEGCTAYRSASFEMARQLFTVVAERTEDDALKARAQFNLGNCYYRLAQGSNEPRAGLERMDACLSAYIRARRLTPENTKILYNLEVARAARVKLADELERQRKREAELRKKLQESIKALDALIKRQTDLHADTRSRAESEDKPNPKAPEQQENLRTDTLSFNKQLAELNKLFPKQPAENPEPTPVDQALTVLKRAVTSQKIAVDKLKIPALPLAEQSQKSARDELTMAKKILEEATSQQQSQQSQNQDGDAESGEGDEGEDQEYSEEDGEISDTAAQAGEFSMNLNTNEVPPPTDDPRRILAEEAENNSVRAQKKASKYKKVKKDW